ncbi:hypothetical protein ABV409_05725 [Flagellimonas sp. DF-77]|uniref:hypothetical protein n=1 Tax=Flagellimonas algarum TaxID=3230298 RepID=UPI003394A9C3
MKTKVLLVSTLLLATTYWVGAQETKKKKDSIVNKQDNFMDLATKSFSGVFGESLNGNPKKMGKGMGFLEFLEQSGFTEKEKMEYRSLYVMQSQEMTQEQRDSLGLVLSKKIIEGEKKKNRP